MASVTAENAAKSTDCYLGLLYVEDVAVYGYMTPLKVKIIIALELSDAVVRDADVIAVRFTYTCTLAHPFILTPCRSSERCTPPTANPLRTRS